MTRLVAGVMVVALLACGCRDGDDGEPEPTPPRPDLVPGDPGDYGPITIRAGSRSATAPRPVRDELVPMLTARVFEAREALSEYGLDRPRARIRFAPGTAVDEIVLDVGGENFDRSGYYVRHLGDERLFLVLDDQLDPVLELVDAAGP